MTPPGLEPTIDHIRCEHANNDTADEPTIYHIRCEHTNNDTADEPTIYHIRCEHTNNDTADASLHNIMQHHDFPYINNKTQMIYLTFSKLLGIIISLLHLLLNVIIIVILSICFCGKEINRYNERFKCVTKVLFVPTLFGINGNRHK